MSSRYRHARVTSLISRQREHVAFSRVKSDVRPNAVVIGFTATRFLISARSATQSSQRDRLRSALSTSTTFSGFDGPLMTHSLEPHQSEVAC